MKRLFTALTLLSAVGLTSVFSPAQDASKPDASKPGAAKPDAANQPVRKQPTVPDFQANVDTVFGDLIAALTKYPFYNIAPWFGLDTSPQLLARAKGGNPGLTSIVLKGHQGAVRGAIFSPNGRQVLTLGSDNTVRLFNLRGVQLTSQPHSAALTGAAMFPGGGEFATSTVDGKIHVYQEKKTKDGKSSWEKTTEIAAHTGRVTRVEYSPDGLWLASAGDDGAVRMWDKMGKQECEFTENQQGVRDILITRDKDQLEERIWILDGNQTIHIGKANGTAGAQITGYTVSEMAMSPGDTHVLLKIGVREFKVFGIDGEEMGSITLPADVEAVKHTLTNDAETLEVEVLDDAGTRRWFNEKGELLRDAAKSASLTDGFYFDKTEVPNAVAMRGHDSVDVWLLTGHEGKILDQTFALDGTRAVTVSEDGTARVWEWFVRGPNGATVSTNIPFVVLWLVVAAVLFTFYMKFVNIRMFGHAIQVVRGKFSNPNDSGEVSHFQALSSALSATVGLGNIAGVAIAVSVGGPGATFWMIIAGLLGMTLKFTECTLGQKFRKIDDEGRVSGGPMHYLKEGLQAKGLGFLGIPLAFIFTVFCIGGSVAGGNAFQVNQSADILKEQVPFFKDYPWVYGVVMAVMVGIVIIGGIKRIAQTAEKIVPTMCGVYVAGALAIIVMNIGEVPGAFGTIFGSALSGDAIYGGALGALITGFQRAAFSNEAGVGSASIAHSAARTPYAVREGIVALLEPFIDTVVVCTMTALVIVITGVYNPETFPQYAHLIEGNNGAGLTSKAFAIGLADWFPWVLMIAVTLFAFSTMISWSYYGERCWTNVFGPKSSLSFKILFLLFTVLGSIVTATKVLEFGDVMILLMAFPNILGLYFLGGLVKKDLSEYEEKKHRKEFEVFK